MAAKTADNAVPAAPMRVEGRVLAGALELRHDGDGGRGYYITARSDIPAGALLLQEAPLATGLAAGAVERVCRCCLEALSPKMLAHPLPCPECRRVRYCSQRCIGDDRHTHAASGECRLLHDPDTWSRLGGFAREAACAARLLAAKPLSPPLHSNMAALTDVGSVSGTEAEVLEAAAELVAAARAATAAGVAAASEPADAKRAPLKQPTSAGEPAATSSEAVSDAAADGDAGRLRAALEAVCCIVTNGLEVLHEEGVLGYSSAGPPPPPAAAVYRLASRLNHSCRPNAAYHFRPGGAKVAVRSLQAIAKGEEVTISYTDLLQPTALRRGSLAERFCFDCDCARCREDGTGGDSFLGAAHPGGSSVEASLASAVEQGTHLFLEQGDTSGCQAVLLEALAASTALQASPLHHRALEAHCCLASACRVAARRSHKPPTPGEINGAAGAGSPASGGVAGAAGVALRAAAAAHALVLAAALQRLVSAGETGIKPQCGKQWSEAAGLLCELLAALPAANAGSGSAAAVTAAADAGDGSTPAATAAATAVVGAGAAADSSAHTVSGQAAGGGVIDGAAAREAAGIRHSEARDCAAAAGSQHLQPWPEFCGAIQSAWRQLLALAAAVFHGNAAADGNAADDAAANTVPAAKRRRTGDAGSGIGSASACSRLHIGVLLAAGAEGGLNSNTESDPVPWIGGGGSEGGGGGSHATAVLAAAAAHCMARAAVHLKVAFGDSHPATETNAFLPFSTGLPFGQAAAIVQQASSLRQRHA